MSRAIVTAKTGIASQNTALRLENLTNVNIDLAGKKVQFRSAGSEVKDFDLVGVTTFSVFVSATDYVFTLS